MPNFKPKYHEPCLNGKEWRKERMHSADRGYDSRWKKARKKYLESNPHCVRCFSLGRLVEATVVDHIKPHRGDMALFWSRENWQSLCRKCHDAKTLQNE